MKVAISSAHFPGGGASGLISEVEEARKVVEAVASLLPDAVFFHDYTSTSQDENLATLTEWHNSQSRQLDVSVHFNAYEPTEEPRGVEVLFLTADEIARSLADAISQVGFINRGAKQRTDLYLINNTDEPCVIIEICFVDSIADVEIYHEHFDAICGLIALALDRKDVA